MEVWIRGPSLTLHAEIGDDFLTKSFNRCPQILSHKSDNGLQLAAVSGAP